MGISPPAPHQWTQQLLLRTSQRSQSCKQVTNAELLLWLHTVTLNSSQFSFALSFWLSLEFETLGCFLEHLLSLNGLQSNSLWFNTTRHMKLEEVAWSYIALYYIYIALNLPYWSCCHVLQIVANSPHETHAFAGPGHTMPCRACALWVTSVSSIILIRAEIFSSSVSMMTPLSVTCQNGTVADSSCQAVKSSHKKRKQRLCRVPCLSQAILLATQALPTSSKMKRTSLRLSSTSCLVSPEDLDQTTCFARISYIASESETPQKWVSMQVQVIAPGIILFVDQKIWKMYENVIDGLIEARHIFEYMTDT